MIRLIGPRVLGLPLLICAICPTLAPAEPQVTHDARPVAAGAECSGAFVSHPLPHTTVFSPQRKPIFAGVGSALGVNDLDNDGDIDIVLANLDAPSSILWNRGGLTFTRQELAADNARAVNIVDFDGDGWHDLILSHPGNPPSLWLSSADSGTRTFTRTEGFGPWHVLNAMALADLDRDGDLDLVGASYDAEIAEFYDGFVIGSGVAVYENVDGKLSGLELVRHAHALALLLTDLDGDGRLDILVGNDFELPDYVFLWTPDGFRLHNVLPRMPRNTMSLDAADIDNDGRLELFSADMKPYADDAATRAAWQTPESRTTTSCRRTIRRSKRTFCWSGASTTVSRTAPPTAEWTPVAGAGRPSSPTWTMTGCRICTSSTACTARHRSATCPTQS